MGNFITTSSDTDAGTAWREKAQEYNDKRVTCFEKSKTAYQEGDHAMAKEWSEKGKAFGKKMEELNEKAAKAIFNALNNTKKGKYPPRTYDFHGLYVKEALQKLEEIMKYAQRQKWSDVTIIVGRGNHSLDGIPKLPSAIQSFAQENSDIISQYYLDQPTKGCVLLELSNGGGSMCIIQ